MIFDSKELIRHVKADEMAAIYADTIPRIFDAIAEIRRQSARLREAFTGTCDVKTLLVLHFSLSVIHARLIDAHLKHRKWKMVVSQAP